VASDSVEQRGEDWRRVPQERAAAGVAVAADNCGQVANAIEGKQCLE
jgi:hypothetical protein